MKLILVVEDEFGLSQSLRLLLEFEGYRVSMASNGREALGILAREVPDLIISDYIMPGVTGAELGRQVRADPALQHVPLIMTTSVDEATLRRDFDRFDAFLRKPYQAKPLIALVAKLLDGGAGRPV